MEEETKKAYTVPELQTMKFARFPLAQQLAIRDCHPRPYFEIIIAPKAAEDKNTESPKAAKDKGKGRGRSTATATDSQAKIIKSSKVYREFEWMCGCEIKKSFFCFPCLLFWCKSPPNLFFMTYGCKNPYSTPTKQHEKHPEHIQNCLRMALLGKFKTNIGSLSITAKKDHNRRIETNRQIMLRIIDSYLKYSRIYELTVEAHFNQTPQNQFESLYAEHNIRLLIPLCLEIDKTLQDSVDTTADFNCYAERESMELDLIPCIARVWSKYMIEEIRNARFVCLIAEETSDISSANEILLVLRYVVGHRVVERLWGFVEPAEPTARSIADAILEALDKAFVDSKYKLIAQSHIGGLILSPCLTQVHEYIREKYQNAVYVHYHAYPLCTLLERAVCQKLLIRKFFANLNGIYQFFLNEPSIFKTFVKSASAYIVGSFDKGALTFVYQNRSELERFFIALAEDVYSSQLHIRESHCFTNILEDVDFREYLKFFHHILKDVDVFYTNLQNNHIDEENIDEYINQFLFELQNIKDSLLVELSEYKDKNYEKKYTQSLMKIEACNIICTEVDERFKFKTHWEAQNLFKAEKFYKFHGNFPHKILENAVQYFQFKNQEKLQSELSVLYSKSDFMMCKNAHEFLYMINEYKLKNVFERITGLVYGITTMPTMFTELENNITMLDKIRRAYKSIVNHHPMATIVTTIVTERDVITKIKKFNQKVLEEFAVLIQRQPAFFFK